jgi:hypothetical protein
LDSYLLPNGAFEIKEKRHHSTSISNERIVTGWNAAVRVIKKMQVGIGMFS